jgi:hypothetical protein
MTLLRRISIFLLGLCLLAAPTLIRRYMLNDEARSYQPPDGPDISFAVTPLPTPTPVQLPSPLATPGNENAEQELRSGPVVVDLAHYNSVNPTGLQPLADALAKRDRGLRLWLSNIDVLNVESFLDYPDQSAALATQLADASALVIISPFFLWSAQEIALVERFVADGGRLLLISDPDLFGDFAAVTNFIGEPFGVVFNDDFLYDTTVNDENYTYFFQGQFLDQAALLDGAQIAFYGGRSIAGSVKEQARSSPTTLSSLRSGVAGFTTMAIGGVPERSTAGRVLALSDFEVLSEPYVDRHDNRMLVEFVAGFLAADERTHLVADFPNYLSKEVGLVLGSANAVSADLVLLGAQLQKRLEQTSRSLSMVGSSALAATSETEISSGVVTETLAQDMIYLADYQTAFHETTVLTTANIQLLEEIITPTVTPGSDQSAARTQPTPGATPEPGGGVTVTAEITGSAQITTTASPTATRPVTPSEEGAPAASPTPERILVLHTAEGLRLDAGETVLVLQQRDETTGRLVLSVMAAENRGISAGVDRLLKNDFADCITGPTATYCPFSAAGDRPGRRSAATEPQTEAGGAEQERQPDQQDDDSTFSVLLVDDNGNAGDTESSEADSYLQGLLAAGYTPDLWATADQGAPELNDIQSYDWVIWSNAAYTDSTIELAVVEMLTTYTLEGGRLTISSRTPLFGTEDTETSTLRDVVIDDDDPDLVQGLPAEPILLPEDLPPAALLSVADGEENTSVILRRGPTSDDAGIPAMFVTADEATGARLHVSGMAINWLPDEVAGQLVQNIAAWMRQN